ncbi:hypothetical protein BSFP_043090 [Burkholderia stabilis]|uniref:Uncharacterized protein n=1 Tax=Burkholderia stabilis TaxID=95485 RepID=A0A1Y1BN78_9BURK|nr:hypothetical protein BSFP_043090 [Burkholderia stabilis]
MVPAARWRVAFSRVGQQDGDTFAGGPCASAGR